jgi:tRNA (guanine-N7-)-methyltransferase
MEPKSYAHAPRVPETAEISVGDLVPGGGPLMIEIGSGRGAFTLEYAALHADRRVVAFEVRRKYAALLADKLAARGLAGRARCFAEDARAVLPRLRPDASVDAVAVHFPDPWWKKRHAKRLVVGDALVAELARLVAPGGQVFVQTDVEGRAAEYARQFLASPAFLPGGPRGDAVVDESPFAPARSNREARALADGLPIYRLVFRRAAP